MSLKSNTYSALKMEPGRAICYSGFRDGQHPGGLHPTEDQILEDLLILQGHWKHLRVYDCDLHTRRVLEVIRKEKLDFKVLLGAYIVAEENNPNCPWGGGYYPQSVLEQNKLMNNEVIQALINWANEYDDIVSSLSVGNEACVDWTDHLVSPERVIDFVRHVQCSAPQPVTFCENYVPWLGKLSGLAKEVDFISVHTYPVWEYKGIDQAIHYTKDNYYSVAHRYPDTPVVITEAGWATNANGRGIHPDNANQTLQKIYYEQLMEWTTKEGILTYVFEAFDENWKGSEDPMEPEKHWGLFHVDRTPKLVMQDTFNHLLREPAT